MPASEDYARNAEDCWRQAETAHDDTERATLVRMEAMETARRVQEETGRLSPKTNQQDRMKQFELA